MADPVEQAAQLHNLLGDPVRVRICRILAEEGELNVGELCRRLGTAQPPVSRHLGLLRAAGAVEGRRDGKFVRYSLHPDTRGRLAAALLYAFGLEGVKIPRKSAPER